jgi:hypothetical protein
MESGAVAELEDLNCTKEQPEELLVRAKETA